MLKPAITLYSLTACIGLVFSIIIWSRRLSKEPAKDTRSLFIIYFAGLICAVLGAKAVYFLAEGWMIVGDAGFTSSEKWQALATGKTVTGALLGGYLGVELAKKMVGYVAPTGDWFAMIVPFGLLLGRVGCFVEGCCLGIPIAPAWYALKDVDGIYRWPSVPVEALFNVIAILAFWVMSSAGWFRGQLFHLYLIAYGLFRFFHEFMRATPRLAWGISGYQMAALLLVLLGVVRFVQRRNEYARGVSASN